MDPNDEIELDSMPLFRIYKSGRFERFDANYFVPPSVDAATGVSSKDVVITPETSSASARLYLPKLVDDSTGKLPIVVYYHGGGFCIGSAFSSFQHSYLNSLVAEAKVVLVSVEYRLAPEHPVPAAYEDSWLALQWIVSHAEAGDDVWLTEHADFCRVFLAGDSSGANIAHHMCMQAGTDQLRNGGVRIKGLVLGHPYFLETELTESDAIDPGASSGMKRMWMLACPSTTGYDDYRINPMSNGAPSLTNLGCDHVLVCVGGLDVLRDRGRAYYEKLRGSGWRGEVELFESEGEGHVFYFIKPTCEKALAYQRKICRFLNLY